MATTVNRELNLLFNQVDDWFEDISLDEPLSQFALDEDRDKLALISRTTLNWFKSLTNPLTSEGIDEDDNSDGEFNLASDTLTDDSESPKKPLTKFHANKCNKRPISNGNSGGVRGGRSSSRCKGPQRKCMKTNSGGQQQTLDSLAKDLELLLEDEDGPTGRGGKEEGVSRGEEPKMYFYNSYQSDDLALLDASIGYCCTMFKLTDHSPSLRFKKEFSVVTQTANEEYSHERRQPQSQQQQQHKGNDLKIQTSMPLDHDYISKPRSKPLVLSNKQIQSVRNSQKESSVLNAAAIKRFAPFSDKFRELSLKHDKFRMRLRSQG